MNGPGVFLLAFLIPTLRKLAVLLDFFLECRGVFWLKKHVLCLTSFPRHPAQLAAAVCICFVFTNFYTHALN